jgi:hypothetical protein
MRREPNKFPFHNKPTYYNNQDKLPQGSNKGKPYLQQLSNQPYGGGDVYVWSDGRGICLPCSRPFCDKRSTQAQRARKQVC